MKKTCKRVLCGFLCAILILTSLLSFYGCDENTPDENTGNTNAETDDLAVINVSYTDKDGNEKTGEITIRLRPDVAPITVANFKKLVSEKFYDGLTFHRIIKDFMIQGGDPKGNGTGGSSATIKGEFSGNGVNNTLLHKRGVVSMARSGSIVEQYLNYGYLKIDQLTDEQLENLRSGYNSASSQFFIVHKDSPHLNGNYAAFGEVISGMEIVDEIAEVPTDSSDAPLDTVKIVSIRLTDGANK